MVFDRCSFGGELEVDELINFFKNCDLFPSPLEVEQAYNMIFKGIPNFIDPFHRNQRSAVDFSDQGGYLRLSPNNSVQYIDSVAWNRA